MPWTSRDAYRHTRKASTPGAQSRWAHVANAALERGDDEASAIRQANAVVGKSNEKPRRPRRKAPTSNRPAKASDNSSGDSGIY